MTTRARALIQGVTERTESGLKILTVADPHALTQAIGWLKFTGPLTGQVIFRGQTTLYDDVTPSLFRGASARTANKLAKGLNQLLDDVIVQPCGCAGGPFGWAQAHRCLEQVTKASGGGPAIVSSSYRAVIEPLLQHYGIKTRWLDVVDNIWIALWFACFRQETSGAYAYHMRRSPAQEGSDAKAYIVVVDTGELQATGIPGYWTGPETRLVDLRRAVPSVYLRPHAQHGLLVAKRKYPDASAGSIKSQIAAVIEIQLRDALLWLGDGAMTSPHVLFPPAAREEGYRRLLQHPATVLPSLGRILSYGPGY